MKALADPRSAEGKQEIQAIKASICDLHEALTKSNPNAGVYGAIWAHGSRPRVRVCAPASS